MLNHGTVSAASSVGQKLKKKRQEPAAEPEAKPRRLRVKKPSEPRGTEEPHGPVQGEQPRGALCQLPFSPKLISPAPMVLLVTRALEMRRGEEGGEEEGERRGGG